MKLFGLRSSTGSLNSGRNSEKESVLTLQGCSLCYVPSKIKSARSRLVGERLRFKLILGKAVSKEVRSGRHRHKYKVGLVRACEESSSGKLTC